MSRKRRKRKEKIRHDGPPLAAQADRHVLYQKAVQAPEAEVEFFDRVFRELRGRKALHMREDFCGTAYLATTWCRSDPERTATGIDIDRETLDWGRRHNVEAAGPEVAARVRLVEGDVRTAEAEPADITCALNFSYCIFKTRDALREYFTIARRGLRDDGLLILDLFGGTECQDTLTEETDIDGEPATYVWEHAAFNPVTHDILCHIHFHFDDGSRMERAFTYDWRLWSIPELRELLLEAGFTKVRVYWERFEEGDDDDEFMEGTGEYYEVEEVENQESWMSYIVAEK